MNCILKYSFSLLSILACSACDNDGIDILDIEIPDGYALSAVQLPIFELTLPTTLRHELVSGCL